MVVTDVGLSADVFPNLDGGCAIAVYRDDKRLEISISPDGRLDLRIEKGIGFQFENVFEPAEDVTFDVALRHIIHLLEDERWKLSVFSTSGSSTVPVDDLGMSSIRIPLSSQRRPILLTGKGGFQSFRRPALALT